MMKAKKFCRRLAALLLAVLLLPCAAFAEGEKHLAVDAQAEAEEGRIYPDIQSAIDYIAAQPDKTGWTIELAGGEYSRFTVLDGLDGLTVTAAPGAQVRIAVADNSAAPSPVSGGYPDTGGVSIRNAQGVVLENLQFAAGTQTAPWYTAAVSTHTDSGSKGSAPVLRGCSFTGSGMGIALFVGTGTDAFTVESCSFEGFREAISIYGDGTTVEAASVTDSEFRSCGFALHGYYGGSGENAGTVLFAGNTVSGSETLRCKIVLQDQVNTGALRVEIRDNTLENAIVGLVNLREAGETLCDVLASNFFGENCHYVEAVEPGTIDFYTTYRVPEGTQGHWVLTGIEDLGLDEATTEMILEQLAQANASEDHTLNISSLPDGTLIKTFTWFKDAIYWESADVGGLTVKKTVVDERGGSGMQRFSFVVTLDARTISGTYGDMEFKDGVATIQLRDGESATAAGLPAGIGYTVKEYFALGYISSAQGDTGVIEKDKTATASFTNYAKTVIVPDDEISVSVQKLWVLDDGAVRPDSVSVELLRSGKLYDTVVLCEDNGWRYTWDGLDPEYSWSVEELDVPEGFAKTIEKNGSVYTIINDDIPDSPQQPDEPSIPDTPEDPKTPDEPDLPDPQQPDTPDVPNPSVPNTGVRRNSGYWVAGMAASACMLLLLCAGAYPMRKSGKETD